MTKIPQEIIAKAIEVGWNNPSYIDGDSDETIELAMRYWQDTALDKDFWIALGKSLGWGERFRCPICVETWGMPEWKHRAIKFFDLILQEQETDSFWQNLLGSK